MLVKLSKCLTCFYNHLSPEQHLTFRDKPIIRITAKFQYKVLLLRTLTVINTISLRHGLEVVLIGRARCTSPQRVWSQKATVDVSMLPLKAQSIRACSKPFSELLLLLLSLSSSSLLLLLLLLFLMMILIIGLTCPPTIHFKFITKCDSLFLLHLRWSVITKCDNSFITKCDKCYYKVR